MLSGTFPDRQRISLPSSISPTPAHAWSSNAMWIFPGFPCRNTYPWMRYISISVIKINTLSSSWTLSPARSSISFTTAGVRPSKIIFWSIPLKERLNVKGVISDAYRTYLKLPEDFFPHALTILDSFHVIRLIISQINTYIYKVLKWYRKRDEERLKQKNHDTNHDNQSIRPPKEVILLQNYKWVILKNQDDINYSTKRYYHKMLGMNVDTFAIEKMFLDLDPNFKKLRDLKEEYIEFNEQDYADEFDVLSSLNTLIDKYRRSDQSIFRDFALFLRANTDPIVNSFIKVKVHRKSASGEKEYYARLSNGPMESFNRKPKDLKRESRGFSDFDYTRNRILWATRENPSVKGIPRSKEEIKTNEGKERGPYKKKKQSSSK